MKDKLPPLATLKRKCDTIWSLLVRGKYTHCALCGRPDGLSAHHWVVSKHCSNRTRWLVDNGISLCYGCHIHQTHRNADYRTISRIDAASGLTAIARDVVVDISNHPPRSDKDLRIWLNTMYTANIHLLKKAKKVQDEKRRALPVVEDSSEDD